MNDVEKIEDLELKVETLKEIIHELGYNVIIKDNEIYLELISD